MNELSAFWLSLSITWWFYSSIYKSWYNSVTYFLFNTSASNGKSLYTSLTSWGWPSIENEAAQYAICTWRFLQVCNIIHDRRLSLPKRWWLNKLEALVWLKISLKSTLWFRLCFVFITTVIQNYWKCWRQQPYRCFIFHLALKSSSVKGNGSSSMAKKSSKPKQQWGVIIILAKWTKDNSNISIHYDIELRRK